MVAIKHAYAEQILAHKKLVEYRKTKPTKLDTVNRMFMYDTVVHKIVGVVTFYDVISGLGTDVWSSTKHLWQDIYAKQSFVAYCNGAPGTMTVHALRLADNAIRLRRPLSISEAGLNVHRKVGAI